MCRSGGMSSRGLFCMEWTVCGGRQQLSARLCEAGTQTLEAAGEGPLWHLSVILWHATVNTPGPPNCWRRSSASVAAAAAAAASPTTLTMLGTTVTAVSALHRRAGCRPASRIGTPLLALPTRRISGMLAPGLTTVAWLLAGRWQSDHHHHHLARYEQNECRRNLSAVRVKPELASLLHQKRKQPGGDESADRGEDWLGGWATQRTPPW